MSHLLQLKLFVNERLAAAAEEIFSAVERTILEFESKSVCQEDVKHGEVLMLAEAERAEEVAAASLEVCVTEAVSTQSTTEESTAGSLDSQGPDRLEDKMHQLQRDETTLHDVLQGETCSHGEQSTETSSCGQTQTELLLLVPYTPADCEEEAAECEETNYCQPVNSESATKGMESRSNCSESVKSTTEAIQRSSEKTTTAFCCKMCGQYFCSWSLLLTHIQLHASNHAASPQGAFKSSQTIKENNLCHICSKTFKTKFSLKTHMLIHTGEKSYCCTECGKRFSRGECLKIHMRIHKMEKPYTCELCKKMFRQKIHLVTHMRIHTGEKPYHCNICCTRFAYKVDLIKHAKIHTTT